MYKICLFFVLAAIGGPAASDWAAASPVSGVPASADSTLQLMKKVGDWQLKEWATNGMHYRGYDWLNAVGYTGLFALAQASGDPRYYTALRSIGDSLHWNTGPNKGMADDYCIAQTYAQLYGVYKDPRMIAAFRAQADSICVLPHTEGLEWKHGIQYREWAWCDALFMGPPALAYLSTATGDPKYLKKADTLWWKTTEYLFDKKEDLYYRDASYFDQREANGAKMFWSRGNGWVMGGLVRMLSNMPEGYVDRPRFIRLYDEMAKKIAALQQPDGTWHTSLLDPGSYPNKETSGTGLYCYALAWGINHGVLSRKHYLPVVLKAWQALVSAVHPDGKLGYVQKVGDRPGFADENSTEAYGSGAFLLAGSEMLKLEANEANEADEANNAAAQPDFYQTIINRINVDLQHSEGDRSLGYAVSESMDAMKPEGFWADIDYDNPTGTHLDRVKKIVLAYMRKENPLYGDAKAYHCIIIALQYWADKNPSNRNWWFNEISFPQSIGQILILMRYAPSPLPRALEGRLIRQMTRKLHSGGFANTSDEALHYLYRACLTHDKNTMDSAAGYLFEPVAVSKDGEGIQCDNSYFQHGRQQAIGSYGSVFVTDSYNAAYYLLNTPYAMPPGQLGILSSFFKNTYLRTIRGAFFDFNVRGRGISRPGSMNAGISSILNKAMLTDPGGVAGWQAAESRVSGVAAPSQGVTPVHTFYWVSGYTLHVRPGYSFNVQISSVRTLRTERGNSENILGKFLPDGATDIQLSGSEYADIMPVWEWDKIPGVTNREYHNDAGETIRKEWGIHGTTDFSGGVSDSLYGVTAYRLDYDSVRGVKSWFFFDGEIVCLGAGITSAASENITTTINQCWLNRDILVSEKDGKVRKLKPLTGNNFSDLKWVLHDSVGYFFPAGGNVSISKGTQKGDWYHINHSYSRDEKSGNVFKMWLNHGTGPSNAGYAYIVVPDISGEKGMRAYDPSVVHIIQNTAAIQAVYHTGLDILQVVFYQPGTLSEGDASITADKPCIIYIKGLHNKEPILYISDPSQKIPFVELSLKLPAYPGIRRLECPMPLAPYGGSSRFLLIKP